MVEGTLSVRLMWPFVRVTRLDPEGLSAFARDRIDLGVFADPNARVPHSLLMELLDNAVTKTGDPFLGLRAGEELELGDLGALEYAARSASTLRGGLECVARYLTLVNDAVVASLSESGSTATWSFRVNGGVKQHPAADDFELAAGTTLSRRLTGTDPELLEVHFAHARPARIDEYERFFACKLMFNAPDNALVFRRTHLETPLCLANPSLLAAYGLHAEKELRRLEQDKGLIARVRAVVLSRLRAGDIGMQAIARAFATSPATLRRRLEAEGTTLTDILDEVRRDLAFKYLADPALSISEVAFLLGFSHVPAFYRAFQRWRPGETPADYRDATSNAKTTSRSVVGLKH